MDNASLQEESFEVRANAEVLDQRHRTISFLKEKRDALWKQYPEEEA